MNNLVFLEPNCIKAVPFTTSKVIAENTGVGHRYIKKQIVTHKSSLETFGLLVAHETESTGGRPEEIISLNEQQSTLLVTFLKNTPVVVEFNTELVRQFFEMRTELQKRKIASTLRKDRGANKKAVALDYMTSDEIALVNELTNKMAVLYGLGMDYHEIKEMLLNRRSIKSIA